MKRNIVTRIVANNKRGMGAGALAVLILLIVGAFVLIMFLTGIIGGFSNKTYIEPCRISVMAQASTEVGTASPFSVNCKTRYVEFSNKHVKMGYSFDSKKNIPVKFNGKLTETFPQLNEYVVNQVLAEEMRICWYQYLEGKKKVFVNNDNAYGAFDDVCAPCSEITFNADVGRKEFHGFMDFVTRTDFGKGYTYLEYFDQPSLSEGNWSFMMRNEYPNPEDNFYLNSTQSYAIFFHKDNDLWSKNGYFVQIAPLEDIYTKCKIMVES